MGCPDWPKCFGYLLPPTQLEQLTWAPGKDFEKGQMIIKDEKLWVAQGNFTTGQNFDAAQWVVYTKHDYAVFNTVHTYVEWINRMISVVLGLFMMLTVVSSFQYWKKQKSIPLLSIAAFLLTLVEAWLGAKVVDSNLEGIKISIHMLGALVIVGLLMVAVFKNHRAAGLDRIKPLGWIKVLVYGIILLTMLQIYYGTQVREAVDNNTVKGMLSNNWVQAVNDVLSSHKSLSAFVMAAMMILFFIVSNRLERSNPVYRFVAVGMIITAVQIALGSVNVFFNLPAISRLLHVTLAGLLIASQFYVALLLYNYKGEEIEREIINEQ